MAAPTLADVKLYLGVDHTWTDAEVQSALDAESAAQARRCTIPDVWPADLSEALKRRVARNLAARAVPIATYTSFEGGTTAHRVPTSDPEIARLEGPHRKVVLG